MQKSVKYLHHVGCRFYFPVPMKKKKYVLILKNLYAYIRSRFKIVPYRLSHINTSKFDSTCI